MAVKLRLICDVVVQLAQSSARPQIQRAPQNELRLQTGGVYRGARWWQDIKVFVSVLYVKLRDGRRCGFEMGLGVRAGSEGVDFDRFYTISQGERGSRGRSM